MIKSFSLLFLFVALTYGCTTDDGLEEEALEENIPLNTIDFTINGEKPIANIRNLSAFTGCGKSLSVSFDHWIETSNGGGYGGSAFNVSLTTNGDLLNVYYRDYNHQNSTYYSPYFTALSTLQIEEFEYIENTMLRLKLSGQIFESTYNYFELPESAELSTEIVIKDFNNCIRRGLANTITTDKNFAFHRISRTRRGQTVKYNAFSNAGHLLEFVNDDGYFSDMPEGVYTFKENSVMPRINFSEFIGIPRAFSVKILSTEWRKYETSGNFEIIKKQNSDGEAFSQIRFNIVARENGAIKYEFTNAVFETSW